MLRHVAPQGPFLTKKAKAYTSEMNAWLAKSLVSHALKVRLLREQQYRASMLKRGKWANQLVNTATKQMLETQRSFAKRIKFLRPTKPTSAFQPKRKEVKNKACVGGLRDPWDAIHKVPGHWKIGATIRAALDSFLDSKPDLTVRLNNLLGSPPEIVSSELEKLDTTFLAAAQDDLYSSPVRANLPLSWAKTAEDSY
jgi:hypothetical protein